MNKIIASLAVMVLAGAVIAGGATSAFFSDTEASVGNSFTAGAIDLKIDNESYYNGNKCTDIDGDGPGTVFEWKGDAPFPVPNTPCTTSWALDDLSNGHLFFNFTDIKPDDESEDTISIHVQNDAWACMDVTLTSNDDKSTTEPEAQVDVAEDVDNTWDGELAQNLQFFWWADDGDNVYEVGENSITNGVQALNNMAPQNGSFSVALADAAHNVWGNVGQPLPANQTVYIAKAWCFGTLNISNPVAAGQGVNPQVASGVSCDGTTLNNLTQTDSATVDVVFRAEQARSNGRFLCNKEEPKLAKITVVKNVVNNNGGNNIFSDFQLFVDNGVVTTGVTSNVQTTVSAGEYDVTETGVSGYAGTYSGDCDSEGHIVLNAGDVKTCTITNDDLPANITMVKVVTGAAPLDNPSTFKMRVDGTLVPNTSSIAVSSNAPHTITEDAKAGYHFVSITGSPECPAVLGGTATLSEGQAITCTITNAKN